MNNFFLMTVIDDLQYLLHQKGNHFLVKIFHLDQLIEKITTLNQLLHYINIILWDIILIYLYNPRMCQILQYLHLCNNPLLYIHNSLILSHLLNRPDLPRLLMFNPINLCLPYSYSLLKFINAFNLLIFVENKLDVLVRLHGKFRMEDVVQHSFVIMFKNFFFLFYVIFIRLFF